MRARRWRRLTLQQHPALRLPDGRPYIVEELRCPHCREVLGWRETRPGPRDVFQSRRQRQPDGSAFFWLPYTETCPCGAFLTAD